MTGHTAVDCKSARKIDRTGYAVVDGEVAWEKIKDGAKTKDFDLVKEGIQEYLKAAPDVTYANLECAFRAQDINLYLIALENPALLATHTHMDLQGNLDKKYRVHFRWNDKPLRPKEKDLWPQSAKENLQRLEDAGETVERGLPRCSNCGEVGHTARKCSREKVEKQHVVIMCYNCQEEGHRIRDCKFSLDYPGQLFTNSDKAPNRAGTISLAVTACKSLRHQTLR
ncbi:hypothetical protein GGS26DRAFT_361467 [Hypomontagnella submonticulosa]|nr:hypothetical protein GGS26DRAFT_361467 [Hypomontagnella submonticulosa]